MYAADPGDLTDLLNQFDADVAALARLIVGALESCDRGVRHVQPRDVAPHPIGGLRRTQGANAGENEDFPHEAQCLDLCHERAQQRQVVDVLGLNELRAGRDFLGETLRTPGMWQGGGILGGTQEYARCEADLTAALEVMLVAQGARDVEQGDTVEVEYGLRLGMIAGLHAVAGQAQHIADAHRRAAQDVALDRNPVLVATRDLHDRRVADARQQRTDREARHMAVGAAAIGGIDRIDEPVEHARTPVDIFGIGGSGYPGTGSSSNLTAQHSCRHARAPRAATRSGLAGDGRPRTAPGSLRRGRRVCARCRDRLPPRHSASRASPHSSRHRARRRRGRYVKSSDSSSDRTCRSNSRHIARTYDSRTTGS